MPTPGFPAETLDEEGTPVWITDLASEDANHTVHVVRDLSPQEALLALGAKPELITSCELPAERPDAWTSLARAAIEGGPAAEDPGAVLLAGRLGDWTFVYDDGGLTGFGPDEAPPARLLSVTGKEAATSTFTINADTTLDYAVDGELLFVAVEELDLAGEEEEIPDVLREAVEAAGIFEQEDLEEGEPDGSINLRVLCALAGLTCTLDDLRRIPLWAAPFS
jgi:hypothetical protein